MKKTLKMTRTAKRFALCALVALFHSSLAFGQVSLGNDLLDETSTSLLGLLSSLVNLLRIAIGTGGLVSLVIAIFEVIKGERDAAGKVAKWFLGLAIGFVVLQVLYSFIEAKAVTGGVI